MADLGAVISGALSEAREADNIPDAIETADGEETTGGEETDATEADIEADADATADADAGDADASGDEEDEGDGEAEKKVVEKTDAEKKAEKDAADKAAKDAEDKEGELGEAKDAKGRENKIPHSRVVKITASAVKKAIAPLAEALGLKPEEFKPEAVVAALTTGREAQVKVKANEGIERLIDASPDRFVAMLAQHHPGYKKFLSVITGGDPAVKPEAAKTVPTEEPQPDMEIKNEKGEVTGKTYSLEGLKKRDEWRDAKILSQVREEFKPLTDAQAAAARTAELEPVVNQQLAAAAKWENWAELKAEVERILVEDGAQAAQNGGQYQHTLRSAYLQASNARLKAAADEAKANTEKIAKETREKVLKEVKARPKSTSVAGGTGKVDEPQGPRSLVDVIRGEVAKLKQ